MVWSVKIMNTTFSALVQEVCCPTAGQGEAQECWWTTRALVLLRGTGRGMGQAAMGTERLATQELRF